MTIDNFKTSLDNGLPPANIDPLLAALWHDAKGNWADAHHLAQDVNTKEGSWVHAYLHRKEGDQSNAVYWYQRAQKKIPTSSFDEEWEALVRALLNQNDQR